MRSFLLCMLLVSIPTTVAASLSSRNLAALRKPLKLSNIPNPSIDYSSVEHSYDYSSVEHSYIEHLNAFLEADDVHGFSQWLQENNIDVNTTVGKDGGSLLYWAARSGKVLFVHRLLEMGAEIEVTNHHGSTPLDVADWEDHPAVIARLRAAGGDTY